LFIKERKFNKGIFLFHPIEELFSRVGVVSLPPRKCGSTDLSQSKAGLPDLKHQIVELMVHDVLKH